MPERDDKQSAAWPQLEWDNWKDTAYSLHMWTQIVGKTRLALTPLKNHWWNVPLYVSARGLTTSAIPWRGSELEIEFDLRSHVLEIRRPSESNVVLPMQDLSVADFYAEYVEILNEFGIGAHIWPMPVEVANPIRFDRDTAERPYDSAAVERFHQVLMRIDAVLARFSTGFLGKISPVHFFWGSFDLCVTRFSGRKADAPPRPDKIQQEAYSHEVISAGFWPGNGGFGAPAFYCYAAPVPAGLAGTKIPCGAWDSALSEFILPYDDVRNSADPDATLLSFLESTYAACADAAHWNRESLDRPIATARCE